MAADVEQILRQMAQKNPRGIARAISLVENGDDQADAILSALDEQAIDQATIIGITGPPGAGKSTLTDEIISHYRKNGERVGVVAVDPSSPLSGGALLGDRVRMMRHAMDSDVVMRSMATRGRLGGICGAAGAAVRIMASSGCSIIIIETVGVGQSEMDIIRLADVTVLVLAPGLGDDIQAMKAGLLEVADIVAVNKADLPGADSVAMDMEAIFREQGGRDQDKSRVCLTVASSGQGVPELAASISDCARQLDASGEKHQRRLQSHRFEVLDWAVELLRPQLKNSIYEKIHDARHDPKLRAKAILRELLSMDSEEKK